MPPLNQIIDILLPYLIGAVLGVVGAFGTGYVKEFFDERARIAKHKRDVARLVLKICNEASTGNFKRPPRDIESINSVLTDVEGVDKEIELIMNNFVNLWGRIVEQSQKSNMDKDETRHLVKMLNDVEKDRKKLTSWSNQLRAGN